MKTKRIFKGNLLWYMRRKYSRYKLHEQTSNILIQLKSGENKTFMFVQYLVTIHRISRYDLTKIYFKLKEAGKLQLVLKMNRPHIDDDFFYFSMIVKEMEYVQTNQLEEFYNVTFKT
jgi:hypothetical protein